MGRYANVNNGSIINGTLCHANGDNVIIGQ